MEKKTTINRIGERFITNKGYEVVIVDYHPYIDCTIQFINDGTILKNITYQNLKKGGVKHPNQPTICNKGYIGLGHYKSYIDNKNTRMYIVWTHMLKRCYGKNHQILSPSYVDCSVDPIWYNFQNFAKWYEENYIENGHLDKDILYKGNRIYSLKTVVYVSNTIRNGILAKVHLAQD